MRILSLHPIATEIIFSLGAGNLLVGRTDECTYPDAALRVPSLGKPGEIGLETVGILEPELILLGPGQAYGGAMRTYKVEPRTLADIRRTLHELGEILGKQVEADMLAHEIEGTLERVQLKAAKFKAVRVHVENDVPSYVLELIRIAGGEPHVGDDIEQFDPQYIITIGDEQQVEIVSSRRSGLRAVQLERVYCVCSDMLRPTPRLLDGAKELAKILHGVEVSAM